MAAYVWWFLIVGLVIGGVVVAGLSMDGSRRDEDEADAEVDAEATLIATQLGRDDRPLERELVSDVLRAHRDYLRVPPPDRLEPLETVEPSEALGSSASPGSPASPSASAADADPDREPDHVGDRRGRGADEDLPPA